MKVIKIPDWIDNNLSIRHNGKNITVFTIPTQHFEINDLSELTLERFEEEKTRQSKTESIRDSVMALLRN